MDIYEFRKVIKQNDVMKANTILFNSLILCGYAINEAQFSSILDELLHLNYNEVTRKMLFIRLEEALRYYVKTKFKNVTHMTPKIEFDYINGQMKMLSNKIEQITNRQPSLDKLINEWYKEYLSADLLHRVAEQLENKKKFTKATLIWYANSIEVIIPDTFKNYLKNDFIEDMWNKYQDEDVTHYIEQWKLTNPPIAKIKIDNLDI